jgi:hypothetical protein
MTASRPVSPGTLVAVLVAALAGGCRRDIRLIPAVDGGEGGAAGTTLAGAAGTGGGVGGAGGETGGTAGRLDGGTGPACTGLGDPIRLPTATGATCAAALATRGHRFALCACDSLTVLNRIRTDTLDSTNAGWQDDNATAAVGTNGGLQTTAELRAGGAIYVGGVAIADEHLQSSASLRVGGALTQIDSNTDVGGDAYVGGAVSGDVRVSGTLHVPVSALVAGAVQSAAVSREVVTVAPPCDCSAGFVDVAAGLALAAVDNGNAAAGLAQAALANVAAPARIDLGCGTTFLDAINAQAKVTLAVHGRALLAVAGDVAVRAGLDVVLDAGAELDLLVGGRLTTSGAGAVFGAVTAPARFRVWVAGTSSISFDDGPSIGAIVHAAAAPVSASAGLTLYGSLLAPSLTLGGDGALHFDRAVLSAGAACGEPVAAPIP